MTKRTGMPMSGHCQFPSPGSHEFCKREDCACECHTDTEATLG